MRKRILKPTVAPSLNILLGVALFLALIAVNQPQVLGLHAPGAETPGAAAVAERPIRRAPDDARQRAQVARVIDGDTFVLANGDRVRVADFDTPETRGAKCAAERARGHAATDAARRMLLRRTVDLRVTGRDRYERLVADVFLVGRGAAPARADADFRTAMIAAGHGAVWRYGREPKPDWCGGRTQT